jgi:DNA polymerase III gamma/tau subunit
VLILITSDRYALFPTIVSRCQTVNFGRLTQPEIETAVDVLLGGDEDEDVKLMALLSENCPGRLLELSVMDTKAKLEGVRDVFEAIGRGHPEAAFAFSRAVLQEAGSHRRKQRRTVGEALELLVFWIAEILRVKQGLPDTIRVPALSDALKSHAGLFDEASLLDVTCRIEEAFALVRWNIDMTLLLDTTLLRLAFTLQPGVTSGAGAGK